MNLSDGVKRSYRIGKVPIQVQSGNDCTICSARSSIGITCTGRMNVFVENDSSVVLETLGKTYCKGTG